MTDANDKNENIAKSESIKQTDKQADAQLPRADTVTLESAPAVPINQPQPLSAAADSETITAPADRSDRPPVKETGASDSAETVTPLEHNAEPSPEDNVFIPNSAPISRNQDKRHGQPRSHGQNQGRDRRQDQGRPRPSNYQQPNQPQRPNQGNQPQTTEPAPPPVGKPIAIRFKTMGEFYFLYDEGLDLKPREKVIVKIAKGKDIAEVALNEIRGEFKVTDPQLRVLRRMNDADIAQQERNAQREKEAFGICLSKIKKLELPMKLLAVKYTFDGSRITFFFKADSKVDFRKLVRELAAVFRTRIELRQIGPRDETELFGGLGVCGRRVCCNYWCCRAKPVISVDAPKTPFGLQGMTNKALGLCSRPLCCLRYEGDIEPCCKITVPAVNSKIVIDEQNGVLKLVDEKANQVTIQLDGDEAELNISYEDFLLKLTEGKAKKI